MSGWMITYHAVGSLLFTAGIWLAWEYTKDAEVTGWKRVLDVVCGSGLAFVVAAVWPLSFALILSLMGLAAFVKLIGKLVDR